MPCHDYVTLRDAVSQRIHAAAAVFASLLLALAADAAASLFSFTLPLFTPMMPPLCYQKIRIAAARCRCAPRLLFAACRHAATVHLPGLSLRHVYAAAADVAVAADYAAATLDIDAAITPMLLI